jgi:hypothetical protein
MSPSCELLVITERWHAYRRESTYVVNALEEDSSLPFSMKKLESMVKGEASSWHNHQDVILAMGRAGRGND